MRQEMNPTWLSEREILNCNSEENTKVITEEFKPNRATFLDVDEPSTSIPKYTASINRPKDINIELTYNHSRGH